MKYKCDCIIPFFNEGTRVIHVVESILKVRKFSKIIVVDDGSTERITYQKLKTRFSKRIILLRLNINNGKANAVKKGLEFVQSEYCLLLDGDLTNIKTYELNNAFNKILLNPVIDMIILRRVDDITSNAWARQDIITSGQRILKTSDLKNVFQSSFSNYQLEVATNSYMIKHNKTVYWMPFSIHGPLRTEKWGFKNGLKFFWNSFIGYFRHRLVGQFIWQTMFFCKDKAP